MTTPATPPTIQAPATEHIKSTPENTPLENAPSPTQQDNQTTEQQTKTINTNKETTADSPEDTSQVPQEQHAEPSQAADSTMTESSKSTTTTSPEIPPTQTPPAVSTPPQQQQTPPGNTPSNHPVTGATTPSNTQSTQEEYRQKMIKALQQQLKALQDNPDMPIMAPNINNQPVMPGKATPQTNPQIKIPAEATQPPSSLQTPRTISIPMGTTSTPGN